MPALLVTFRIVDSSEVGRAHAWHAGFAAANDAIYPRTEKAFYRLTLDRNVWCAITEEDELLGMSYACMNDDESEVEVGGLMVAAKTRGKGIGDILMRLPLCHFLVNEDPLAWNRPPRIVAHALKGNELPRRIITRAGFQHATAVSIPADVLPGLRTEADGLIHGDEFHLQMPGALSGQADWLDSWSGTLRDGTAASISLLPGEALSDWASALRAMG